MKTTKLTVGYSRYRTVIDIRGEKLCVLIFLLAPAQAVADRVYHKRYI